MAISGTAFPPRHLSIRVPWSDVGWQGRVCNNPIGNHACLVLNRIADNRDDDAEQKLAGTEWSKLAPKELPPCSHEHGAFMSARPYVREFTHPYRDYEPGYENFRTTRFEHPAYSAACTPYFWMLREMAEGNSEIPIGLAEKYGIDYDANREPVLKSGNPTWVQARANQLALLDTFFSAVRRELSLCFFYAKKTPLSEDPRRVIIGIGRVKSVDPHVEYAYATDEEPNSVVWERNVHHSLRPSLDDGFLLPYHQLLDRMADSKDFDPGRCLAFAPDDHFNAFSFGSEHVTDDEAIASLTVVLRALEEMRNIVEFDIPGAIEWVNKEINRLWKMRGPFPGLEPPRVCRRPFRLSHAAMAGACSMA